MESGYLTSEAVDSCPVPAVVASEPAVVVPDDELVPSPIPTAAPAPDPTGVLPAAAQGKVEPVVGHIVIRKRDGLPRIKPGPIPMRLGLIKQFIDGVTTDSDEKRTEFIRQAKFTPKEKSYIVSNPVFKALYDAKLFDLFIDGMGNISREDIKLLELIGRRVGVKTASNTQVNVQVNNNQKAEKKDADTTIRVQK